MEFIEKNLIHLKDLIRDYERNYNRPPGSVKFLAASKTQLPSTMSILYHAGQKAFGENFLQEALKKMAVLSHLDIEWHFIGRIQSNKTKKIAEHFAWVQSVVDIAIAERLNAQRPQTLPPLNICIEVNVSHEPSKAGIAINHVIELAEACRRLPNLKLRGLMAIPAPSLDFDINRKQFHSMLVIQHILEDRGIHIDTLSMGMSNDFEAAIAEGSTMVRIGTALFGPRVRKND